jgi:membrane protease subunit (stomatin/prohibitin family)
MASLNHGLTLFIIDSVVFWEIIDPYTATYLVSDVCKALLERTQTTLRSTLGTRTLQDCIEHRDSLAADIQNIIAGPARSWGVKIESVLIKDLVFSEDLQESLAEAAKQRRVGESKVIMAKAEVDSAKLMREAADILSTPGQYTIISIMMRCQKCSCAPPNKLIQVNNSFPRSSSRHANTIPRNNAKHGQINRLQDHIHASNKRRRNGCRKSILWHRTLPYKKVYWLPYIARRVLEDTSQSLRIILKYIYLLLQLFT